MKLFLDTANIEEIREINRWGVLSGVTTNPSLVARRGRPPTSSGRRSSRRCPATSRWRRPRPRPKRCTRKGVGLAQKAPNAVVKVPMTPDGLEAGKRLTATASGST